MRIALLAIVFLICTVIFAHSAEFRTEDGEIIPISTAKAAGTSTYIMGLAKNYEIPTRPITISDKEASEALGSFYDVAQSVDLESIAPLLNIDQFPDRERMPRLSRAYVLQFKYPPDVESLRRIEEFAGVNYIEPNTVLESNSDEIHSAIDRGSPPPTTFADQWNLHGGSVLNPYGKFGIDCMTAWSVGQTHGDPAIRIGVYERGIHCYLDQLEVDGGARIKRDGLQGYVFDDQYCAEPGESGHGTQSGSVIGMNAGFYGIIGVVGSFDGSDRASLYSLRTDSPLTDDKIAAGIFIAYAADILGCHVVSLSQGFPDYSPTLRNGMLDAFALGTNVVATKGQTAGTTPRDTWYFPADNRYSRGIGVGTYGRHGEPCETTDGFGCAGGETSEGYSTFRWHGIDLLSPGEYLPSIGSDGSYLWYSGASGGTPLVAGCIGLLRSYADEHNIVLGPEDYEGLLRSTAVLPRSVSGEGEIEWRDEFGAGRVNVGHAMSALVDYGENASLYTFEDLSVSAESINDGTLVEYQFIDAEMDGVTLDGTYQVEVFKVTASVTYPDVYVSEPYVWPVQTEDVRGCSAASPNFGLEYNIIADGSTGPTGCDMVTYVFAVHVDGEFDHYFPCAPADVQFACRAMGPTGLKANDGSSSESPMQISPNPFNPATTISFDVETPARTRVRVFDVRGRRVRDLMNSRVVGPQSVEWDGRDDHGVALSSGTYFFEVEVGENRTVEKAVLVK